MTSTTKKGFGETSAAHVSGRAHRTEQVINTLATWGSNAAVFVVTSGVAFLLFLALWVAFAAGLLWSPASVDQVWRWIGDLPLLIQAVVWLLFLPVMVGLWVWETAWPLVLRLVIVAALAAWSVMIFLPRGLRGLRP